MQTADLTGKVELEIVGRFLPNLLDRFLEQNPEIRLTSKKAVGNDLSFYYIGFQNGSSLKVSNMLTRAEDSLGYCVEVYFKVLEGNFPEKPFGPFKPIRPNKKSAA
jgi:hypothetical protein